MRNGLSRLRVYLDFIGRYVGANLQGALEYRLSFVSQVVAMLLNDLVWLIFWLAYFTAFPLVAGWDRTDIITLWAVIAAAFGLADSLFGGTFRLAGMIVRGELDFFLALPKPPLLHMLVSRMNLTAPGDVAFGLLVYGLLVRPSPVEMFLFALFMITGAIIFVAFGVLSQSLAFWLGNAEGLAQQFFNALITFSTYPTTIFRGIVKAALFSVIPAGFIAYVPVQLLRSFSWPMFGGLLLFTMTTLVAALLVFERGLRRYESGNLVLVRE
jgi:ABC-2 type transport system permease protein